MSKRARIIAFVSFIQSTLFFTHFFIYKTWTFAAAKNGTSALWLKVTVGALSVSFLAASLLAFRYSNRTVRTLYRIAAVWLGIVSFLFFAAGWLGGGCLGSGVCCVVCELSMFWGGSCRG